ncbi:TPA: hypothetical protein DD425_00880 [Candidatus Saccharibacteria bacterium]|nr:hypothetical protein [Candidatus Saccharibacteria bacterium]
MQGERKDTIVVDQTRFTTVEPGITVLRELHLIGDARDRQGETFTLHLDVDMTPRGSSETGMMPLYVDRISIENIEAGTSVAFTHTNGDDVFKTKARIEPEGESFDIDVTTHLGDTARKGAYITVSSEMERVIFDYLFRVNDMEHRLQDDTEE